MRTSISLNILNQCYLQLKVYLCLVEAPDCLVVLKSSWQISSLLQGVASGNQSTLSHVLFKKHTSSNKNQEIQHLATKSPTNPLPTSSAASVAGTVFSCDFASFSGRFGKGKRSEENWAQRGSEKRKPSTDVEHVPVKYHLCHLLIFGFPFFKLVDLVDASEQFGWCVQLVVFFQASVMLSVSMS